MNKLILQKARLLQTSSLLLRSTPQFTYLQSASAMLQLSRRFHAGHNHDHDHDDGKESHSDFQAKAKKAPMNEEELNKQFAEWIANNNTVLFMKGNRKMPRCGFSNYVVQVLKFYGVKEYKDVDVLADEQVREGIKKYSNWPTIPQLYIKGTFIGGCDIVKEMHQDGSLEELLVRENLIPKEDKTRIH